MKKLGTILVLVLAMALVLCLSACGGNENETPPTDGTSGTDVTTEPLTSESEQTEPTVTEPEAVEYVYTIKVMDVDGAPVSGVFVQVCAGVSCVPMQTDANGIAGYVAEVTGDGELTAKIMTTTLPEGYACVDGIEEISMADGNTDVVFTLERVA